MPLRLFVADEVAAFRLFALDDDFDGVAGVEPSARRVVESPARSGMSPSDFSADVDDDMLVGDLDDGAGNDAASSKACAAASAACSRSKVSRAAAKSSMPSRALRDARRGLRASGRRASLRRARLRRRDVSKEASGLRWARLGAVGLFRGASRRWGFQFGVQGLLSVCSGLRTCAITDSSGTLRRLPDSAPQREI